MNNIEMLHHLGLRLSFFLSFFPFRMAEWVSEQADHQQCDNHGLRPRF